MSSAPAAQFHMIQAVEAYQKKPVADADVEVQAALLALLEGDAAVAVHDPLRQPGRARRVDDPQRMVERQLLERRVLLVGDGIGPGRAPSGSSSGNSRGTLIVVRTVGRADRSSATTSRRS